MSIMWGQQEDKCSRWRGGKRKRKKTLRVTAEGAWERSGCDTPGYLGGMEAVAGETKHPNVSKTEDG